MKDMIVLYIPLMIDFAPFMMPLNILYGMLTLSCRFREFCILWNLVFAIIGVERVTDCITNSTTTSETIFSHKVILNFGLSNLPYSIALLHISYREQTTLLALFVVPLRATFKGMERLEDMIFENLLTEEAFFGAFMIIDRFCVYNEFPSKICDECWRRRGHDS